ncbi:MAG: DUF6798 domain-containing protein [Candidatus Polarisedimenticolia bacterium]
MTGSTVGRAGRHAIALSCLLGALLLHSAWLIGQDARIPARTTDQMNIGLMVLKTDHPELFSRDQAFSDPELFRFYTPTFLEITRVLNRWTGDLDPSLRLLLPVLIALYAVGMYVLLYDVTGSVAASAAIAGASSLLYRLLGSELWGVASMKAVLPRSLFLAVVPWVALALLRWWRGGPAWLLPTCGLAAGLAANVHPVSGLVLVEVLLVMSVLGRRPGARAAGATLLTALLALIGASPMVAHFLSTTAPPFVPDFPFEAFRSSLKAHHRTFYPFARDQAALTAFVVGWMAAMILWLIALWCHRRGQVSGALFAAGLALQLPAASLITLFRSWPLILMAAAYAWLRWKKRAPDRLDWGILALMATVAGLALAGTCALDQLWARFELWKLSTLVGEHGRAARLLPLPLFLLAARLIAAVTAGAGAARRWAVALALAALVAGPSINTALRERSRIEQQSAARHDFRQMAAWARNDTPVDSLFYTDDLEFRLRAQRSITHCWKDIGLSYYTMSRFQGFLKRYREMQGARGDPARLAALSREHGIDYVVEEPGRTLPFEVVFRNDHHVVYRLSARPD